MEDGTVFYGKSVGNQEGSAFGEVSFNTGMTGYQELMTDPSGYGQIMVSTAAHIGGYGINEDDMESDTITISGLVVRNFSYHYSRNLANTSLEDFIKKHNLLAISDVDTRALTIHIRDNGTMNGVITTEVDKIDSLKSQLAEMSKTEGVDWVSKVSTQEAYDFGNENAKYRVAVLDLGVKRSFLQQLANHDCYVRVFPHTSSFAEMESFNPDGYFISNGPGDPRPLTETVETVKSIIDSGKTVFGVCLGHQMIALANGIGVTKLKNGHRGLNHPVKNLITGRGEITSQNHGYVLDKDQLEANENIEITHINVNDETVAGIRIKNKPVFSVQYHPGAKPGPEDSIYLFQQFVDTIEKHKSVS